MSEKSVIFEVLDGEDCSNGGSEKNLESVFTSLTGYYSGAEHTDDFRKAMEREPES